MAQDEYIRSLMNNYRPKNGTTSPPLEKAKETETRHPLKKSPIGGCDNIKRVLQQVRELNIEGDKKRLIKIDNKNEDILKVLYPVFSVDVTRFVNFILTRYFEEHPELIQEIKESFKEL